MLNQLERFNQMSLFEKTKFVQWLATFPALTLISCWRGDLGYRLLNPLWIGSTALFMVAVAAFCPPDSHPGYLLGFAGLFFFAGNGQRFKRLREFRRGVRQHSFYIGSTGVRDALVPNFCRRNRLYERYLEPAAFATMGFLCFGYVSTALGAWLVLSAICLAVVESAVQEQELNRQMDMVDGLVASEIQSGQVERFMEPTSGTHTAEPSAGIATGLSPELQDRIARRNRRPKAG